MENEGASKKRKAYSSKFALLFDEFTTDEGLEGTKSNAGIPFVYCKYCIAARTAGTANRLAARQQGRSGSEMFKIACPAKKRMLRSGRDVTAHVKSCQFISDDLKYEWVAEDMPPRRLPFDVAAAQLPSPPAAATRIAQSNAAAASSTATLLKVIYQNLRSPSPSSTVSMEVTSRPF
jgi:hypothetical protein